MKAKRSKLWLWALLGAGAFVLIAWAYVARVQYKERTKHWVFTKCFWGAAAPGTVTSMRPVALTVWRLDGYCKGEATNERLLFQIPAAYLYTKDDLDGGSQYEILLSVAWPSGEPYNLAYAKDRLKPHHGLKRDYDIRKAKDVSLSRADSWSRHYTVSLSGSIDGITMGHDPIEFGTRPYYALRHGQREAYLKRILEDRTYGSIYSHLTILL